MKRLIFYINTLLLRLKRNRKIANPAILRLNLGSGMTVNKGWCNIDGSLNSLVSKAPNFIKKIVYKLTGANRSFTKDEYVSILTDHEFLHHDLRFGLPFNEASIDYIYSSHFFEHLFPEDLEKLLSHSFKTLKPGGKIRISIPDLEYAISLYPDNRKDMLNKYFFINHKGNDFSNHKYMYDFTSLSELLKTAGFDKIERCTYQQGDFPDIHLLDNRERDSLIVQAKKP